MKLFLVSQWLLPEFRPDLEQLVGKPLDQTRAVLIENGADDEPDEPRWVKRARDSLTDAGIAVTQLDLRQHRDVTDQVKLRGLLSAADVIWVGGGNTFYLNWLLKASGARGLITELMKSGKVYAGGSAGGIVAGPTIEGFEAADDASFAPEQVLDGMGLTDTVVVPHWGRGDYGPIMERIARQLNDAGYTTQPLTDREALLIDGSLHKVISA